MLLLKWILDCKSKNKRWRVCWSFLPVLSHAPPKSEQRCVSRIIQRAWSTNYIQELSSCIGPVLWVTAQLQRKSWQLQCVTCLWGSGWIFLYFWRTSLSYVQKSNWNATYTIKSRKYYLESLSDGTVISPSPGLSLPAALSSGSGSQCSSAGACYSPGSAAAPAGSGTPSDPRAERNHTHITPKCYFRILLNMYRVCWASECTAKPHMNIVLSQGI